MVARSGEKRNGISKHELVRDESFWFYVLVVFLKNKMQRKVSISILDMNVMWFPTMNHRLLATVSTFHHVLSDLHV